MIDVRFKNVNNIQRIMMHLIVYINFFIMNISTVGIMKVIVINIEFAIVVIGVIAVKFGGVNVINKNILVAFFVVLIITVVDVAFINWTLRIGIQTILTNIPLMIIIKFMTKICIVIIIVVVIIVINAVIHI